MGFHDPRKPGVGVKNTLIGMNKNNNKKRKEGRKAGRQAGREGGRQAGREGGREGKQEEGKSMKTIEKSTNTIEIVNHKCAK